jgi:Uma2 family endonuclease
MPAHPQLQSEDQMTVEEFLAFADTRPQEERWELIEGVPVLSPSPVEFHQVIAGNILSFLLVEKRRTGASWLPMIGVGTRVPISPRSLPRPDVFVKTGPATDRPETSDAVVIFEVLSRSNSKRDQAWRRRVYASVPNCQHYVTVSMKAAEATVFDRTTGWLERPVKGLATMDLPAIGVRMPLAEMYCYTPLGA